MHDTASIIIGISSGIGGALAAVTAFLIAFRSLEKSVEAAAKKVHAIEARIDEEVRAIDTCLARKIDKTACDQCHEAFEKELARGSRHFDDLYATQKHANDVLADMQTNLKTLLLRTSTIEATLARITRVEVRLPGDPGAPDIHRPPKT